jgi:maltoporin
MPVSVKPLSCEAPASLPTRGEFIFGSFGRMGVFTNQFGKEIPQVDVVSYIPRLQKQPYLELYLGYNKRFSFGDFNALVTPAIAGDPFHYTGQFQAAIALRNAYLDVSNIGGIGLFAWAGSRMYRGDDVYLLDFWPLDNLNTLGGGLGWRYGSNNFGYLELATHLGFSRVLGSNFFSQQILVADQTFGATEVVTNDRQRLIGSLKASYYRPVGKWFAFKLKLYFEGHSIAPGAIELRNGVGQVLPGDAGWVFGGQISMFIQNTKNYFHFFVRHGENLGAYNALGIPFALNADGTTSGAKEDMVALSLFTFWWEHLGVVFGGYYRNFQSARNDEFDADSTEELAGTLRVNIAFLRFLQQGIEMSVQRAFPKRAVTISDTEIRQISPAVFKLSLMPTLVSSPENFPELTVRLIYTFSSQNPDSRYLYVAQDPRVSIRNYHFFGIQAEWLFELRL